jgi:hypothetical protein
MPDNQRMYHKCDLGDLPDKLPHPCKAMELTQRGTGINDCRELSKGMKNKRGSKKTAFEEKKMVSYDEILGIEGESESVVDDVARKEVENQQKRAIEELSEEERKTMTDGALNMFFLPDEGFEPSSSPHFEVPVRPQPNPKDLSAYFSMHA